MSEKIERLEKSAPSGSVAIIIPAFNEAEALGGVLERVLAVKGASPWEIIVVDDGSSDGTADVAARYAGQVKLIRHPSNRGYGASLKTGILATRAESVLFFDADGQHDAAEIPRMIAELDRHECVFSQRPHGAGIPMIRRPGKWVLHRVCNFLANRRIPDLNSGFRAGRRHIYMMMLELLPDGFSFSTTSLIYVLRSRFSYVFMPIQCHPRIGKSSVRIVYDGLKTILLAFRLMMLFDPLRALGYPAVAMILVGLLYQAYIIATVRWTIVGGALLSILVGVVMFLFALLGDQVASLRKELGSYHGLLWENRTPPEA